ncbi:MAG: hypothetical protein DMF78_18015 [Acidobacteria bacterium]|nr:MAG: hypothetical protein DMF78_18015 [Acidobacteriota bacterium]
MTFAVERRARPGLRARAWLRGLLTMWILVRPVSLVLVVTMAFLPWQFDRRAAALSLFAAAADAEPDKVWPALTFELALIRRGRCAEARGVDETVRRLLARDAGMRAAAEATRGALEQCRTSSAP